MGEATSEDGSRRRFERARSALGALLGAGSTFLELEGVRDLAGALAPAHALETQRRSPDVPVEALGAAASIAGHVVDAALQSAQEMLGALDRGPLNAEGALRLAVRMENQFSLVHVNYEMIVDFAAGAPAWRNVDDAVMGGRSSSGTVVEEGVGVFRGYRVEP